MRIDRHTTATRITAKQTNGRGGYGSGRLTVDRTIDAPLKVFDDAIAALNSIDFWKIAALDDAAVLDGTRYVIESSIGDEYHVIERASPGHGERVPVCSILQADRQSSTHTNDCRYNPRGANRICSGVPGFNKS